MSALPTSEKKRMRKAERRRGTTEGRSLFTIVNKEGERATQHNIDEALGDARRERRGE